MSSLETADAAGEIAPLFEVVGTGDARVIAADCPWTYNLFGQGGHGAVAPKYATMTLRDLQLLPVHRLAHPGGCALFQWAVGPKIPEAISVMRWWGFRYVTCAFSWTKTNADGSPFWGMGSYTRSDSEFVLLGIMGSGMAKIVQSHSVLQNVVAPAGEHSAKPDEVYRRIEALLPGPRVELFARRARDGWSTHGDEPAVAYDPAVLERLQLARLFA